MNIRSKISMPALSIALISLSIAQAPAQVPSAIAASGDTKMAAILHAEGVQLYECMLGADRKLAWQFREPIATLISDGITVGRHYAGPHWEHTDGSIVQAKVKASSPGGTSNDIPWLKLDVTTQRGNGVFSKVTTVQRINTRGGAAQGPCDEAGGLRSIPYSADYIFLRAD